MPITIGSNISSLLAQRQLSASTRALNQTSARLSSGLRINRAGDDAAGLAISESLKADERVLHQGIRNINDGLGLLSVADGAMQELSNIVTRIKELAEQSANGIYGSIQRAALDREAQALTREFSRVVSSTEFNGRQLLLGSYGSLRVQGGYGTDGGIQSSLGGAAGSGTFTARVSYQTASGEPGSSTRDAEFGDINGDGFLDSVAVTNSTGGSTRVSLGNGAGDMILRSVFSSSFDYSKVRFGDVNGDGKLDIVATNTGTSGEVRLGNGDGSFRASTSFTTGSTSSLLTVGDLNGDGFADIISGRGAGAAYVRLSSGDGSFGAAVSYATDPAFIQSMRLKDVNSDGVLDLITSGNTVTVSFGNGDGSFQARASYSMSASVNDVVIDDFNNDGIMDLVSGGTQTFVRLGIGGGSFGAAVSYAESTGLIETGDLNGDGNLDIASAGGKLLFGNGDGSFTAAITQLTVVAAGSLADVALGDLNGDGVLDLMYAVADTDNDNAYMSIFLQTTTSGTSSLLPFDLSTRAGALQAIAPLDRKLSQLSAQRGTIGSFQSRLSSAVNNLSTSTENYMTAASRIADADVAQEAAELVRGKILQNAAALVLAQANLQPELALTLIRSRE